MNAIRKENMSIPIEVANVIEYRDLEELIKETYEKELSVPRLFDCNNESFFRQDAFKFNPSDDTSIEENIREWQAGDLDWPDLDAIFIDLANKDLIPEGKYYILVSW